MIEILAALAVGAVTGVLAGALGIGGGAIMVPVMVLAMGVDQATAQGTSLLAILPTAASGAFGHLRHRSLDPRLAVLLGLSGAAGAVLGALLALRLDHDRLRQAFAVYLLLVGAQTLRRGLRRPPQAG